MTESTVSLPPLTGTVAPPQAADLAAFEKCLRKDGLLAALHHLNARTPHRFTGVFQFDGETLRSVALIDKWDALLVRGEDVPIAHAYCAHLHATGEPLEVEDGDSDPRTPWMANRGFPSYCGAVIRDEAGGLWGALCHFDTERCQTKNSDMPLIVAAASIVYQMAARHRTVAAVE